MATATPATGQANQPLGNSVAQSAPALRARRIVCASLFGNPAHCDVLPVDPHSIAKPCSVARGSWAPALQFSSMLHCYIPGLIVTAHQPASPAGGSPLTNHAEFNRQPARLESIVTRRKQPPASRFNRQLFSTFSSRFRVSARPGQHFALPPFTSYESRFTSHAPSNRHMAAITIHRNSHKTNNGDHVLIVIFCMIWISNFGTPKFSERAPRSKVNAPLSAFNLLHCFLIATSPHSKLPVTL